MTLDDIYIKKLKTDKKQIIKDLYTTMTVLKEKLRNKIVKEKLRGQVLNRVSGRLGQSIKAPSPSSSPGKITATVYSSGDVKYARIHEYGGVTKPHIILPRRAKTLAFNGSNGKVFAKKINHPGSRIPERSYMRSSLKELTPTIESDLKKTIMRRLNNE